MDGLSKVATIDSTSETKKSKKKVFNIHDLNSISALTQPQKDFFVAYHKHNIPVIFQLGSAGTGKTLVALYSALSQALSTESPIESVVVVRSAVQAREIGYLKGDEEQKNEVYEAPYAALCDELFNYKSNNYKNLKERGLIRFENTSFLRGKTFDRSVIVVDEMQSMSYHELSTVMTRLGKDSRIVFCGDYKQNDLHRRGDISGLPRFMKVIDQMDGHYVEKIYYTPDDIVRSGVVREFLTAEETIGE